MSLIHIRFFSKALGMQTAANVILPQPHKAETVIAPLPVLYLLHGMGDDYSMWLRRTGVERYALDAGLAVVMPDGDMSCYENMAHGQKYRDFIAEELPEIMRAYFPLSHAREDTFIAGCSMGGYGAVKLGLSHPCRYSAIGCLSSAHTEFIRDIPSCEAVMRRVYGGKLTEIEAQIEKDAAAAAQGNQAILLWHCCGDQDILKENALKTKAFFERLEGGALQYHFEMLKGRHDWALWDRSLESFIRALPLAQPAEPPV